MQELIEISILTPSNLMKQEQGQSILEMLCRDCPEASPEVYGNYEPLRTRFSCLDIPQALQSWNQCFLWKNRKWKVEGGVWMAWYPKPVHGWISISVNSTKVPLLHLKELFKNLALAFRADFACLHYVTEADIPIGEANDTVFCLDPKRQTYSLSVTGHDLRKYLPDIYWNTILGRPYLEHFGRERLLAAPAHSVQEVGEGAILIELAPSPSELCRISEETRSQKDRIKSYLGADSFFQVDRGKDFPYSVPTFQVEGNAPDTS